eukprot:553655_1
MSSAVAELSQYSSLSKDICKMLINEVIANSDDIKLNDDSISSEIYDSDDDTYDETDTDTNDTDDDTDDTDEYTDEDSDDFKAKTNLFGLEWKHIKNAITHELYDKIASALMVIVKTKKYKISNKGIKIALKELAGKKFVQNEVKYIQKLITRAKDAFRMKSDENKVEETYYDEKDHKWNEEIGNKFPELHINVLYDIYNVHNCFLFNNYQFAQYSKSKFLENIEDCKYFGNYGQLLANIIKSHKIPTINLFTEYVIDDDMYSIWGYLFGASYLAYQINSTQNYSLQMTIIPQTVVSVYDTTTQFPVTIDRVDDYLISKNCSSFEQLTIPSADQQDSLKIGRLLEDRINLIRKENPSIKSIQIIVDRRQTKNGIDKLFMLVSESETNKFNELKSNYFISLQFDIKKKNVKYSPSAFNGMYGSYISTNFDHDTIHCYLFVRYYFLITVFYVKHSSCVKSLYQKTISRKQWRWYVF